MRPSKYLTIGRIVRPHGVKGQVEIVPLTDNPERFKTGTTLVLKPSAAGRDSVLLSDVAWKKGRVLAAVEGVDDREGAEALIGRELMIPQSEGEKPADAYWHHEIIGCRVVTDADQDLGSVTEIIRTGGHDVYAVGCNRQYLIPATKEVVIMIDIEKRLIRIKPLPGLLEL